MISDILTDEYPPSFDAHIIVVSVKSVLTS
jgi:hypothetical protein